LADQDFEAPVGGPDRVHPVPAHCLRSRSPSRLGARELGQHFRFRIMARNGVSRRWLGGCRWLLEPLDWMPGRRSRSRPFPVLNRSAAPWCSCHQSPLLTGAVLPAISFRVRRRRGGTLGCPCRVSWSRSPGSECWPLRCPCTGYLAVHLLTTPVDAGLSVSMPAAVGRPGSVMHDPRRAKALAGSAVSTVWFHGCRARLLVGDTCRAHKPLAVVRIAQTLAFGFAGGQRGNVLVQRFGRTWPVPQFLGLGEGSLFRS